MKLKIPLKSIIFDLDGTLIDTVPDVRIALNHMLLMYNQATISASEIYELIGNGAQAMLKGAFAKSDYALLPHEMNEALMCYLAYYKKNPVVETKIYPGVIDTLSLLKKAGIKLGICTNKPAIMTHLVLEKLNLNKYFSAIVAGDEVADPKPHAHHIYEVLNKMGMDQSATVMVGDSRIDQASAKNASVPFVGVSYGYDLDSSSGGLMINHFAELPNALTHIT